MPTNTRAPRRTNTPPLPELVDTAEAVALARVTRRHLYRLTAEGLLPRYKIGGRNRYWVRDLERLVSRPGAGGDR